MGNYSLSKIHLPEDKLVVKALQTISLICATMCLISCVVGIIYPSEISISIIGFLFFSLTVFTEKKNNNLIKSSNSSKQQKQLFTFLSIIFSLAGFGVGVWLLFSGFLVIGVCFNLISIALLLAHLKFTRKYHLLNLIMFVVLIMGIFSSMENIYAYFSSARPLIMLTSLYISVSLVFISISILFAWPDRGFMYVFTADAVSNKYALRILLINLFINCIFGILIVLGIGWGMYSSFEAIAILVIVFIVCSSVLFWINLRLLYRSELERFLMKEELRVHNISIDLSKEDLVSKMVELEGTKNEYAKKLNYQKQVMEMAEDLP
jgi:hypothetical protein